MSAFAKPNPFSTRLIFLEIIPMIFLLSTRWVSQSTLNPTYLLPATCYLLPATCYLLPAKSIPFARHFCATPIFQLISNPILTLLNRVLPTVDLVPPDTIALHTSGAGGTASPLIQTSGLIYEFIYILRETFIQKHGAVSAQAERTYDLPGKSYNLHRTLASLL